MPKPTIPSSRLLSSISQSTKVSAKISSIQCARLSTFASTPTTSRTTQPQCIHEAIAARRAFSTSPNQSYKTVQEQRSRYRSGVCSAHISIVHPTKLTYIHSPSHGKQDSSSSPPAQVSSSTFDMRRREWKEREWQKQRKV